MENFVLESVVADLRSRLVGLAPGRIFQPEDRVLVFDFKCSDGRMLVFRAFPSDPILYLATTHPLEVEAAGSDRAFAALLRKHLRGTRLDAIEKSQTDRIVHLVFSGYGSSGDIERKSLVVRLTGRSTNATLLDSGNDVLGSLVDSEARPQRVASDAAFRATPTWLDQTRWPHLARVGLSPTLARELAFRETLANRDSALDSIERDLARHTGTIFLAELVDQTPPRIIVSTFPLQSVQSAFTREYHDPSEAIEAYLGDLGAARSLAAFRKSLTTRVDRIVERAMRAKAAVEKNVRHAESGERFRELAESLLAQTTSAFQENGGYWFVDYYSPVNDLAFIEADPRESPQHVAERLFARHRKAKRTRETAKTRLEQLASTLGNAHKLRGEIERASSSSELEQLFDDIDRLEGVRRVSTAKKTPRDARQTVSGARRFVSTDGFEILVGRSSSANDTLTFKIARPSDLWLHVADYPGSHVIVRNPVRRDLPQQTVVEAAQLAAFYSEAKHESLVDVRYCQRKFVSKPRGAAPGLVRLSQFKTIAVRPSSDLNRAQ